MFLGSWVVHDFMHGIFTHDIFGQFFFYLSGLFGAPLVVVRETKFIFGSDLSVKYPVLIYYAMGLAN